MTLRHSRKRDKIYLKKLCYLRNFLGALRLYRAYLKRELRPRPNSAIDGHHRRAFAREYLGASNHKIILRVDFYQPATDTTVILRFHKCQLTLTSVIRLPHLFSFAIAATDKTFKISLRRETFLKGCERVDSLSSSLFGGIRLGNESSLIVSSSFRPNVDELVRTIAAVDLQLHDKLADRK